MRLTAERRQEGLTYLKNIISLLAAADMRHLLHKTCKARDARFIHINGVSLRQVGVYQDE
jgi:hypothetical protein